VAPSNPALAGSVSNGSSLSGATAVAVAGNYAYTTAYWAGTLTAIDVSNPAQTQIAGQSAFSTNLVNASTVNVANGYAYVVSKNGNQAQGTKKNDDGTGNSLTILDIHTNPAVPAIVGTIRDAVNLFGAYGIATSGNYAFVAAQGCLSSQPCPNPSVGDAFDVVNVSVPSNPTIVATLRNSALAGPWAGTDALKHATSVALAGNYT
jgi:hypothetical protein